METTSFTYKTGPCSDVLIIGGGLAGMYSALAAAESGAAVRILCKSKTGGSGNSVVAMSVHRFAPDAPGLREDYRRRFLASGAGQQDAELAAFFVDHAAAAMERLRGLGLPLEYRTLSENGGEYPYLACCSPKQGRILTKAVREKLNEYPNIAVEDGVTVCDILTENGPRAGRPRALRRGDARIPGQNDDPLLRRRRQRVRRDEQHARCDRRRLRDGRALRSAAARHGVCAVLSLPHLLAQAGGYLPGPFRPRRGAPQREGRAVYGLRQVSDEGA